MWIVLDTNIVLHDLTMRSPKTRVLREFLRRTSSQVVLPEIVELEITAHIERTIAQQREQLEKTSERIEQLTHIRLPKVAKLDVKRLAAEHLARIHRYLRVPATRNVAPIRDHYLRDLVTRAINKKRPCSDRGEEIRDALIWVSILDFPRKADSESIAFISNNTRQFADDSGKLHPDLRAEAQARGLSISYYTSLDEFMTQHAPRIGFITKTWLARAIPIARVRRELKAHLLGTGKEQLQTWATHRFGRPTAAPTFDDFKPSRTNFWAYELADGTIQLEVRYFGYATAEILHEPTPESTLSTPAIQTGAGAVSMSHSIPIHVLLSATVRDRKIVSQKVTNVEFWE